MNEKIISQMKAEVEAKRIRALPDGEDWRGWIIWNEIHGLNDYEKNMRRLFDKGIQHLRWKRWNLLAEVFGKESQKLSDGMKTLFSEILSKLIEYFAHKEQLRNARPSTNPYIEQLEREVSNLVANMYVNGLRLESKNERSAFFASMDKINKILSTGDFGKFYNKTFRVADVIESFFREGKLPTRKEVNERLDDWQVPRGGKKHYLDKPLERLEVALRDPNQADERSPGS